MGCKGISYLQSANGDEFLNYNFNWYICVKVMKGLQVPNDLTIEMSFIQVEMIHM